MNTPIRLRDYFVNEALIPELQAERSDAVVAEMVAAMAGPLQLDEATAGEIARQVSARERRGSSALGRGFALPHIKHAAVPRIAFGIARSMKGVNFAALDGKPVQLFALVLAPEDTSPEYAAVLTGLLAFYENKQSRRFLLTASTREALVATVEEA